MSDKDNNQNSDENSIPNTTSSKPEEIYKIVEWVSNLKNPDLRVTSLVELSKQRDSFSDLAIYLWYSPGVISSLLQEILETYKLLAPPTLTLNQSNHTCNVLALFQCIAAHSETRPHFLNAQIPIFLYPFLNTLNKNRPFEYLRLTALGVIGALVKVDNSDVINFLLSTEIIPLCLRIMERGSDLSKTVATFIVQRILLDDNGLNYVCNTAERFYAVSTVLNNMMNCNPTPRLIKHIIRCYARLSENSRVSQILRDNVPQCFKDKNFQNTLDDSSKRWLHNLNRILSNNNSFNQTLSNQKSSGTNGGIMNENSNSNNNGNSYIQNNPNFNQMNNMQNINQMNGYENYYYNPNNMNYMPNDQNNFFVNSNNYYIQMNKMYPNNNYNINPNLNPNSYLEKK